LRFQEWKLSGCIGGGPYQLSTGLGDVRSDSHVDSHSWQFFTFPASSSGHVANARRFNQSPLVARRIQFPQFVKLLKKFVYDHKFYDENEYFMYMENL